MSGDSWKEISEDSISKTFVNLDTGERKRIYKDPTWERKKMPDYDFYIEHRREPGNTRKDTFLGLILILILFVGLPLFLVLFISHLTGLPIIPP